LVLRSPQSRAQHHIDVATEVGPIFNMWIDVMKPVYNFEPKYRVTMLTREAWTGGRGTRHTVKGLVWYTDGFKTLRGAGAGVCG
jgi:hypothetical protein